MRARACGFDGVELHMAHAYTLSSFLSRLNPRRDAYGGTLENRLRLPRARGRARARGACGDDFPVGVRFLGEECIRNGYTRRRRRAHRGAPRARGRRLHLALARAASSKTRGTSRASRSTLTRGTRAIAACRARTTPTARTSTSPRRCARPLRAAGPDRRPSSPQGRSGRGSSPSACSSAGRAI